MYTNITVFFLIVYFICITNGINISKIQRGGGIEFNELFSKLSNNPGKTAGVILGLIFLIGLIVYFSISSSDTTSTDTSTSSASSPPATDTPVSAPATAPGKCINNPCRNGGNCIDIDENNYSCVCPQGYSGPSCETYSDTAGVDITVIDTTFTNYYSKTKSDNKYVTKTGDSIIFGDLSLNNATLSVNLNKKINNK